MAATIPSTERHCVNHGEKKSGLEAYLLLRIRYRKRETKDLPLVACARTHKLGAAGVPSSPRTGRASSPCCRNRVPTARRSAMLAEKDLASVTPPPGASFPTASDLLISGQERHRFISIQDTDGLHVYICLQISKAPYFLL